MSSATSIDRAQARTPHDGAGSRRRKGRGGRVPQAPQADPADTFKPWHFFVLASLIAATVAVVMAPQARPEQLVLVSLTIGAAGFAGAALYRTLVPLVSPSAAAVAGEPLSESKRAVLEREKALALRSIKELEFDRAMGKVSAKDFDEMAGRLRTRAMLLMKQLDTDGGYRELIERELSARVAHLAPAPGRPAQVPVGTPIDAPAAIAPDAVEAESVPMAAGATCVCGTANDPDAAFCKRCGARLQEVHAS